MFGLSLYVPYMLCDERALENYDSITFGDLLNYSNRTPEMKDYLIEL